MNSKELLAYRKQIINDAVRMERKPDRTPIFSNQVTWMIFDAGYKLSEAMYDYNIFEKCLIEFQKKYNFDLLISDGVRNPVKVTDPIGPSPYVIDDEKETIYIEDINYMDANDYDMFIENPNKFLWEVFMVKKYNRFNNELTLEEFDEVLKRYNDLLKFMQHIQKRLVNEFGCPHGYYATANMLPGIEYFFNYVRGIKGISYDMRKIPEKLKVVCDTWERAYTEPILKSMEKYINHDGACAFDFTSCMLCHTVLSEKQWETFYWPYLKRMVDDVVAEDKTMYIFSEGSTKRFWKYLKEFPKGHIAMHIEQDDIFEFKKELPNICAIGGLPASILNGGTKEQCISYAKHLIDELGDTGFILSEDKMISYRNDTKAENLKAVCDFVINYR